MEGLEGKRVLKYCPFCGSKLYSGKQPIRFCAVCGKELFADKKTGQTAADFKSGQDFDTEQIKTMEDVVRFCENFIYTKRREGWPEETIHSQVTELSRKLKQKINLDMNKFSSVVASAKNRPNSGLADYYSVILKECPVKETLARHLECLLLRGYFAIRMAIDKVPSVLIYKSNLDNGVSLIRALRRERAAMTVAGGDFDMNVDVNRLFSNFFVTEPDSKYAILSVPANLWLGDRILQVVLADHAEYGNGTMVITDQALYFLYRDEQDTIVYKVFSYYRIADIKIKDAKKPECFAVSYADSESKENFRLKDAGTLSKTVALLQQSLRAGQYRVVIQRKCLSCGEIKQEEADEAYEGARCVRCGQKLERKLVKNQSF